MKQIVLGILAHVDAGKTTLSEAMLYQTGAVKKLGRVDHGSAFLDTFALERERGITIFAKQAVLGLPHTAVTLLDTPGHVDFSAETERTLQVLDCAVLVVSGTDGVQAHTRTLWQLLARHHVPTFVFVNKMDLADAGRAALMDVLQQELDEGCVDFSSEDGWQEPLALCDEALLERYLEGTPVTDGEAAALIRARRVFPCYFGAALRLDGVDALLDGLDRFAAPSPADEAFGAQVFKISRDIQGVRLTHLKVTGGQLRVRDTLTGAEDGGWSDKVNQIRIYSGAKYQTVSQALPGQVCAVTGLDHTRAGMGLGTAQGAAAPVLAPVLTYRLIVPEGCDNHSLLQQLRQLEEEEPLLRIVWNERLGEIELQLMGEVQLEVLTRLIADRFGVAVGFDTGHIVYHETIASPAIGIGHFEPLRHYAEVQLLLEPGAPGSGLQVRSLCDTDTLDLNWQRLILTHLTEKTHLGVLTGAPVTDLSITLLTGRAHLKHTEGGDFREATYRAVRQGLMQAESVLLEPYYRFELTVPAASVGRAIHDIGRMHGDFAPPVVQPDGRTLLTGTAPVSEMRNYSAEVAAYARGEGRLVCTADGYRPCHNADEILAQTVYDPTRDLENTPDSVFCAHGAGYSVPWDEVPAHAHLDCGLRLGTPEPAPAAPPRRAAASGTIDDAEIRALFERTYGPIRDRSFEAREQSRRAQDAREQLYVTRVRPDDYLLVDGYNIIFAWDETRTVAADNLDAARELLLRRLANYQGVRACRLIVVFDAYRVAGGRGSIEKQGGMHVVFTREAETADMYIEQASYDLARRHRVRVATSDGLEQVIILGHGAERMSAEELLWEVEQAESYIRTVVAP